MDVFPYLFIQLRNALTTSTSFSVSAWIAVGGGQRTQFFQESLEEANLNSINDQNPS